MSSDPNPTRIKITWQEPVMMQIGKSGISDNIVDEAKRLLKTHQYIKIRILRSAIGELNKLELMRLLCDRSGAKLAGARGNTAVIYRTSASRT